MELAIRNMCPIYRHCSSIKERERRGRRIAPEKRKKNSIGEREKHRCHGVETMASIVV